MVIRIVIYATLLLTGCATSSNATPSRRPVGVILYVENHNWSDAIVYAVRSGGRIRVGDVRTGDRKAMVVPLSFVNGGTLELYIRFFGSNASLSTRPLSVAKGQSARSAGRVFGVSPSTAVKWAQHWRLTGEVPQARPRGPYRCRLDGHHDWLFSLLAEEPDLTLAEILARLRRERGAVSSINGIWRYFERHKMVFKKNRSRRRATTA